MNSLPQPRTLDHVGIAARVPHSGSMCLLHRLNTWTAERIECTAISHQDPANPLRTQGRLLSPNAIEYASQAMALHGTLSAAPGSAPTPGFLASVRGVRLRVPHLDEVPGELTVTATKLAGDTTQALYTFALHNQQGTLLVDGRATVILNALP
ncbi:MAG: hydroxymyristoyl-ACP dehydratase [Rubrivivax sp.]|nr:hydroxymyristoyl-ACP dehydratase [Rubrivivax sp.]MDP3615793.1 hydroxymyristoyl-ACP dehydratase [Rubrivivax sp.]